MRSPSQPNSSICCCELPAIICTALTSVFKLPHTSLDCTRIQARMAPTVAVLGAGGPTGLECVKRLLAATKDNVCAIVRDPSKYKEILPQVSALSVT